MNRDETDERVKRSLNDVRELAKAHEQLSEEIGSKFSESTFDSEKKLADSATDETGH